MTAMSMSYFALDMRTPKKCIVVDYAGTNFEVMYEVFGELIYELLSWTNGGNPPFCLQSSNTHILDFYDVE